MFLATERLALEADLLAYKVWPEVRTLADVCAVEDAVTDLHLFLAELDGRPVGTALATVCPTGVTVSGVAVEPTQRRRGIGAALTRTAAETAPDRPATLSASDLGIGTYRRLGFTELSRSRHWTRRT